VRKALLDTNLWVDWIRQGLHADLASGRGIERHLSAVVLMELHAGARTRSGRRNVEQLERIFSSAGRIVAPSPPTFARAGAVLARLHAAGREVRRASLVNDVLIALTAREIGATVFTADAGDFAAIAAVADFDYVVVGD
jgi:predicted nucleic acid-binding protein